MDYWIKENKAYVVAVGAMGAFLLVYHLAVVGPIRAEGEAAAKQLGMRHRAYSLQTAGGVPEEAALAQAEADLRAHRQRLEELIRRLQPVVEEIYRPKGRLLAEPGALDNLRLDLRNKLAQAAGQDREQFGFAAPVLDSEEAAREALLRLGVAEKAVGTAIEALRGEGRVLSVDPFRGMDSAERGAVFVRRLPVEIRMIGNAESLFRVLHALQTGEGYYCVDTLTIARAATTGQDSFEGTMVVAGLAIDSTQPLERRPVEE